MASQTDLPQRTLPPEGRDRELDRLSDAIQLVLREARGEAL
jgi:hypothetical protein